MLTIEQGDILPLLIVAIIFYWVGHRIASDTPLIKTWTWRLAGVMFIVVTALYAAGNRPITASDLLTHSGMGLLFAALSLGPSLIVLSIVHFLYQRFRNNAAILRARRSARQRELRDQNERQRLLLERERNRPELERQAREAEARRQSEGIAKMTAQRKREDARAKCELLYNLHVVEIGDRFSRQMFDDFISKYMTDAHAPDDVERRADQLQALIHQHCEQVRPLPKFKTVQELADWFQQQKSEIQEMPVEDRIKRAHLAELNQRYAELTSELLQRTTL